MKLQIDALLQQEMTRKEFLQYAGSALLMLFGVSSVIKALQSGATPRARKPAGYGASLYGK